MRSILKKVLLNTIVLASVAYFLPGLTYNNDLQTLLIAALALALINAFLRPFIKILFLPINIITLGIAGWFINVLILYITTSLVAGFSIDSFTIFLFGSSFVLSVFWAYVVISFVLNIVTTFINWILK